MEVAEQWTEARRFREAGDAYIEALMALGWSPLDQTTVRDGWLGMNQASGLWIRAAEMEWRAGAREDALEALAKGMIFGTDAEFETGLGMVERFKEDAPAAEGDVDDSDRLAPGHVLRIADLYREVNAHPRALWVLELHRERLGDKFEERFDAVLHDWLRVVDAYLSAYFPVGGEIYAFGVNMVPEENRRGVRVPAGMDPKALRAVRVAVAPDDAPTP